jgi:DNA-binding NarL/FixJ family response regulator
VVDPVGVLIACTNRLLRESLARIVNKRAEFRMIGVQALSVGSGEEFIRSRADVVVLDSLQFVIDDDICFPKGPSKESSVKCILVAMENDRKKLLQAVRLGVLGYVLREASAADVVVAIRAVAKGEAICPPQLVRHLFDYVISSTSNQPNNRARTRLGLTRREQELIPLIGRGLTNKEIANQLKLSEQTVKNHVHRILRKVGVEDRLRIFETCQTQEFDS